MSIIGRLLIQITKQLATKGFRILTCEHRSTPSDKQINKLICLANDGKHNELLTKTERLLKKYPDSFQLWNIYGAVNFRQSNTQEAEKAFRKATELASDFLEAYNNLGATLVTQEKIDEAIVIYEHVLDLEPESTKTMIRIGDLHRSIGRLDDAMIHYRQAIATNSELAVAHLAMGIVLSEKKMIDDAISCYHQAINSDPSLAEAHMNLGNLYRGNGEPDKAIMHYRQAIDIRPDFAAAHYNLSSLKKYDANDNDLLLMIKAYKNSKSDDERCSLCFSLSKAFKDANDINSSFEFLKEGNAIRKKILNYNINADKDLFNKIINTPNKTISTNTQDSDSCRPIFILGMPRSGTTLVEQIISSHPSIEGGGELYFFGQFAHSIAIGESQATEFTINKLRLSYLNELKKIANGHPFVTDKMPQNFLYIDLILTAFPQAKIIHVRRDAKSTCWSNYKQYFTSNGMGYSYDLHDVVEYYKLYKNLMNHWESTFPNTIYHLDYESLVKSSHHEIQKLFNYLDLELDSRCLLHANNKRFVTTASDAQVRKPIYSDSNLQWMEFSPYINDIFSQLT